MEEKERSGNFVKNMILNDKAGMEGLDKEKINQIIKEASEGSKYYEHKQKAQQKLDVKLQEIKLAASRLNEKQIQDAIKQADSFAEDLKKTCDLSRTIVHIDMDAFYAAVEMRDNPQLRNKPIAVGGMSMLSTSNYLARKFGVRAAMPGFIAKKLCPDLIIVSDNFEKYRAVSKEIREIFSEYDPNFAPMSLDEAYLDITDYLCRKSASINDREDSESYDANPESVVEEIRRKIFEKTELTASAGIAVNTRLAKICSDQNKPNGQFFLPADASAINEFISKLPVRKVGGVGNITEQQLAALGITTCQHLWEQRGLIKLLFSNLTFEFLIPVSLGLGSTEVDRWTEQDRKSISTEETFSGTNNLDVLLCKCKNLSFELADEMNSKNILGKAVTLKIKTVHFKVKTRISNLIEYTSDKNIIYEAAKKILISELSGGVELRLMGVRVSSLVTKEEAHSSKQVTIDKILSKHNTEQGAECPICNKNIPESTINSHLDDCLSKETIREVVKVPQKRKSESQGRTLDTYFNKKTKL